MRNKRARLHSKPVESGYSHRLSVGIDYLAAAGSPEPGSASADADLRRGSASLRNAGKQQTRSHREQQERRINTASRNSLFVRYHLSFLLLTERSSQTWRKGRRGQLRPSRRYGNSRANSPIASAISACAQNR